MAIMMKTTHDDDDDDLEDYPVDCLIAGARGERTVVVEVFIHQNLRCRCN